MMVREIGLLTACIADGVTGLIPTPQRSDGSPAVLARNNNRCVLSLDVKGTDVDWRGWFPAAARPSMRLG